MKTLLTIAVICAAGYIIYRKLDAGIRWDLRLDDDLIRPEDCECPYWNNTTVVGTRWN
jgi:hypothetical protein